MKKLLAVVVIFSFLASGCAIIEGTPLESLVLKIKGTVSPGKGQKIETKFAGEMPERPEHVVKLFYRSGWEGVDKNEELLQALITENLHEYKKLLNTYFRNEKEREEFASYYVFEKVEVEGKTAKVYFHNPRKKEYFSAELVKVDGQFKIDSIRWRPNPTPAKDLHP